LLVKVLVVRSGVVTPVVFHNTPSFDDSHKYVRPVPKLAPVTESVKLTPGQMVPAGPVVVPPASEPGVQGGGGKNVYVVPLVRLAEELIALLATEDEAVAGLPGVTLRNEVASFKPIEAVEDVRGFTVPYTTVIMFDDSKRFIWKVPVGVVVLPPPPR
jgi:hypothetical protein